MGLFGRESHPEPDPRELALRQARDRYQARRSECLDNVDSIEVTCKTPGGLFDRTTWRMRVSEDDVIFFPEINRHACDNPDELNGAQAVTLRRERYTFSHTLPEREIVGQEGDQVTYVRPRFEFTIDGPRVNGIRFSVYSLEAACRFFTAHPGVLQVRPIYDLFDGPEPGIVEFLRDESKQTPSGRQQIWREEDTLYLHRLARFAGRQSDRLELTVWPLEQVAYFRMQGTVRQEYVARGGELQVDHTALWRPHLTTLDMLEDAVSVTPVRTECVPRDERVVELALTDGRRYRLSFAGFELLRRLMPEKEFERQALEGAGMQTPGMVQGRKPTPVEELAILAGLLERGHLTQAEFDEAKKRLLGQI